MVSDIGTYIWFVLQGWEFLAFGLGYLFWQAWDNYVVPKWDLRPMNKWVVIAYFMVCFAIASFTPWREQYKEVQRLSNSILELDLLAGSVGLNRPEGAVSVVVIASISNSGGTPSNCDDYSLQVLATDGNTYTFPSARFYPSGVTLATKNDVITLPGIDDLRQKTSESAISQGQKYTGYISFKATNVRGPNVSNAKDAHKLFKKPNTKITLSCVTMQGETLNDSELIQGPIDSNSVFQLPGLHPTIQDNGTG